MSERGMGSAVGQVPEYCEQITRWVMEVAKIPVIVKLTPNITNIVMPGARRASPPAPTRSRSSTPSIRSSASISIRFEITPNIGGKGGHGGYAGPAVKPIALNMLAALGTDDVVHGSGLPISGMGGITTWKDAAEFLLLGASSLQVCTAVMHYGFRIVEDLCDGLSNWMDSKGFATIADVVGKSLHRISDFKDFDLSFRAVARIDTAKCIKCNLCYVACNDTAHQCIDLIDRDGNAVQPYSYDVRSNGKAEAIDTRPSRAFAKRIASAAASATTSARWITASRWWKCPPAAHPSPGTRLMTVAARSHRRLGSDEEVSRRARAFMIH